MGDALRAEEALCLELLALVALLPCGACAAISAPGAGVVEEDAAPATSIAVLDVSCFASRIEGSCGFEMALAPLLGLRRVRIFLGGSSEVGGGEMVSRPVG